MRRTILDTDFGLKLDSRFGLKLDTDFGRSWTAVSD